MIILGAILLILGLVFGIGILWTIGLILLIVGLVLLRHPETYPLVVRGWMSRCREEFLDAYRITLRDSGMPFVLDERLLSAFELEQELRELVYAERHLPDWAYAPLGSLRDLLPPPAAD